MRYIQLRNLPIDDSEDMGDEVVYDYDKFGNLVGVEFPDIPTLDSCRHLALVKQIQYRQAKDPLNLMPLFFLPFRFLEWFGYCLVHFAQDVQIRLRVLK